MKSDVEARELIIQDRDNVIRVLATNGGEMTTQDIGHAAFYGNRVGDRNLRALRGLRRAQSDGTVQSSEDTYGNTIWKQSTRASVAAYHRRLEREMLRHGHITGRTTKA